MKPVWLLFLLVLGFYGCNKTVTPQDYNGEYPYLKSDGTPLKMYQPSFISSWQEPPAVTVPAPVSAVGQYSLMFKGHDWNHWPYINVSFRKGSSKSTGYEDLGGQILGVNFAAQRGYYCEMETVSFIIPARTGWFRFGHEVSYSIANPSFNTKDCDAPKDVVVADSKADNWVDITSLDTLTRQITGSFDLSFRIARKDTSYSIIYPTTIRMQGSFKGPFTTR